MLGIYHGQDGETSYSSNIIVTWKYFMKISKVMSVVYTLAGVRTVPVKVFRQMSGNTGKGFLLKSIKDCIPLA